MTCPMSYTSNSYVSALNKRTTKEPSRQSQQQNSLPLNSFPGPPSTPDRSKVDDGGWSMGTPEKGSGWSSSRSYTTNLGSWGTVDADEILSSDKTRVSEKPLSSEQNISRFACKSRSASGQRSGPDWTDSDEVERSQSPGGLKMINFNEGDNNMSDSDHEEIRGNQSKSSLRNNNWAPSPNVDEIDTNLTSVWDSEENPDGNPKYSKEQTLYKSEYGDKYNPGNRIIGEVPVHGRASPNGRSSGCATPTQDNGGRISAESTSSVNSLGSVSSWKSEGKGNNQRPCANGLISPRKSSRCDRSNSQSGFSGSNSSDKDSNGHYKVRKPKKPLAELEDGLGSLHCEPSGWGELPSPKPCDIDNGTELWGVPPADQNRPAGKSTDKNVESLSGHGWGDTVTQVMSTPPSAEWEDEDSSGAVAAGWNKDDDNTKTLSATSSEWELANEVNLENKVKDQSIPYNENLLSSTEARSTQDGCSSTSVDCDLVEGADERNGDVYPQSGKCNKLSKPNLSNDALVLNEHQQLSSLKQTLHNSSSDSSVQNQLLFLKLLQESGGQQVLSQRLGQLQMHKQQLLQQLNQLSNSRGYSSGGVSTVVQQQNQVVSHKLTAISQMISQINQQLMILSQLSTSQQRDGGKLFETAASNTSSKAIHDRASQMHLKNDPRTFGRSQSVNSMMSLGTDSSKSLAHEVQSLSLSTSAQSSVSQSVRSMSRLQQIISSSSSSGNLSATPVADNIIQSNKPMTLGFQCNSCVPPGSHQKSNVMAPFSPSVGSFSLGSDSRSYKVCPISTSFTTKKSVSDIQEFRPGVPWQPKSQAGESAQGLLKQASVPSGSNYDVNTFHQSPRQHVFQLTRSHSTSGSYYGSSNSPQSSPQSKSGMGYERQMSLRVGHKAYIHSQQQAMTQKEVTNSGSGWKLKGRTVAPPSSLYLSQELQYKPGYGSRKHNRVVAGSLSQYNPADHGNWVSSFSVDNPRTSSMISPTMWRPDSGDVSIAAESSHQGWNHGCVPTDHDWIDSSASQPRNDLPASFTQCSTSSLSDSFASTTTTSDIKTWGQQDGIRLLSSKSKQSVMSPEPTFAEWQAGKKARLSVNKNPPWFIVRTANSQMSDDLLREVFKKYGTIQDFIVCPSLQCVLMCYQSAENVDRIKEYLNVDSDLNEANVIVQFASKSDIDLIINRSQNIETQLSLAQKCCKSPELPTPKDFSTTPSTPFSQVLSTSDWDGSESNAPLSFGQQSSDAVTPGSSLWSDSGFLSGLSSPWHGGLTVPTSTNISSTDVLSPQDSAKVTSEGENATTQCNSSVSPFLPNGLL